MMNAFEKAEYAIEQLLKTRKKEISDKLSKLRERSTDFDVFSYIEHCSDAFSLGELFEDPCHEDYFLITEGGVELIDTSPPVSLINEEFEKVLTYRQDFFFDNIVSWN